MQSIHVRDIIIGEGKPKIVVPIVGKTKDDIEQQVLLVDFDFVDLIEWRVDFFDHSDDLDEIINVLKILRDKIKDKGLIFTFRTKSEGGEKAIRQSEYTKMNKIVAESGLVDIVDVEMFMDFETALENIKNIHAAGVMVIGSNHDFEKTPCEGVIVNRLMKMHDMGADIPKIAVMPSSRLDVVALMSATLKAIQLSKKPLATMSMREEGMISRIAGEFFGSSLTFGAVGKSSAPGQIQAQKLHQLITDLSDVFDV